MTPVEVLKELRNKFGSKCVRLQEYRGEEYILLGPIELDPALAANTKVRGLTVEAEDKRSFYLARALRGIFGDENLRTVFEGAYLDMPDKFAGRKHQVKFTTSHVNEENIGDIIKAVEESQVFLGLSLSGPNS